MTSVVGEPCTPGKYTPLAEGSQSLSGATIGAPCRVCPGGKYSGAAALECTSCGPGKYSDSGVCVACPAGRYGTSVGNSGPGCDGPCVAPAGYGCPAGSASPTGVVCPVGTYNDVSGGFGGECFP